MRCDVVAALLLLCCGCCSVTGTSPGQQQQAAGARRPAGAQQAQQQAAAARKAAPGRAGPGSDGNANVVSVTKEPPQQKKRRNPTCNNVDIALHIRYVSDYAAVHNNMTGMDEARMIRRTMERLHRGKWAAYVIKNQYAAGRTVLWTIPGKNYCNMAYRGWYYTVWRVDRADIPTFEYGLHKVKALSEVMFKDLIDEGAVYQVGK